MSDENAFKRKFTIRTVYFVLLGVAIVGILIFLWMYFNSYDFGIIEVVTYITGATATVALVYHAFSLEYNMRYHERTMDQNAQFHSNTLNQNVQFQQEAAEQERTKITYDVISRWTDPGWNDSKKMTREMLLSMKDDLSKPGSGALLFNYLVKEPVKREHLGLILDYFENVAMMVEKKHIDAAIVKTTYKSLFLSYYKLTKNYIKFVQDKQYPDFYVAFENLCESYNHSDRIV